MTEGWDGRIRRRTIIALAACLLAAQCGEPAYAAGDCAPIAKVKKDLKDGVTVTSLSPGQLNWLRGYWMGTPPQLQGAYPGSSAVLMERKGAHGGVLLWVRGSLYCNGAPVPPQFVDAIRHVKTGPVDGDGDEL